MNRIAARKNLQKVREGSLSGLRYIRTMSVPEAYLGLDAENFEFISKDAKGSKRPKCTSNSIHVKSPSSRNQSSSCKRQGYSLHTNQARFTSPSAALLQP
jgi:hypothetical protein